MLTKTLFSLTKRPCMTHLTCSACSPCSMPTLLKNQNFTKEAFLRVSAVDFLPYSKYARKMATIKNFMAPEGLAQWPVGLCLRGLLRKIKVRLLFQGGVPMLISSFVLLTNKTWSTFMTSMQRSTGNTITTTAFLPLSMPAVMISLLMMILVSAGVMQRLPFDGIIYSTTGYFQTQL